MELMLKEGISDYITLSTIAQSNIRTVVCGSIRLVRYCIIHINKLNDITATSEYLLNELDDLQYQWNVANIELGTLKKHNDIRDKKDEIKCIEKEFLDTEKQLDLLCIKEIKLHEKFSKYRCIRNYYNFMHIYN